MKISEVAHAAARLSVVNAKSQSSLDILLRKWFTAQFIKPLKLPLLRSVYGSGAYPYFAELLAEATDPERSAILTKLDKHHPTIQMEPKARIMEHIEALAAGRTEPVPKPKPPPRSKASTPKAPKGKAPKAKAPNRKVGVISVSKY